METVSNKKTEERIQELEKLIESSSNKSIKGLSLINQGKVRNIYAIEGQEDKLLLETTDRHSSFDRVLADIPGKGKVLNQVSKFWFEQTQDIVPNHLINCPTANTSLVWRTEPLPIEVIVRGYLTGVTNTSLWTRYQAGERDFGHFVLPDGMRKNQKLEKAVLTPTTKAKHGDENISPSEIVSHGLVSAELWAQIEDVALRLFERGQEIASKQGLILVDTKYEFGLYQETASSQAPCSEGGFDVIASTLMLIDEVHTPDSSRYWQAKTYAEKFAAGQDPDAFDKEFLRLWFKDNCDPYKDEILPEAPAEMVEELSRRYQAIYTQLMH